MHRQLLPIASIVFLSCTGSQPAAPPASSPAPVAESPTMPKTPTTFEQDVAFLRRHGEVQVLEAANGSRVAVSAEYQGRVMTSAVSPDAASLGWIHRGFIEEGKTGTQFDNYGGEDRFWLGPEGGQFGFYFPAGSPFTFDHWQTPAAFQQGAWAIVEKTVTRIRFRQPMTVANYTGTRFALEVQRSVELLEASAVAEQLGMALPDGVDFVAYQSVNEVTNTGEEPWTRKDGLPSIWILGMYPPSQDTIVVVPFEKEGDGPPVNDAYFGKVPPDRLIVDENEGVALFRCDAQHRSKIGLSPKRSKPVLGSYSASSRMLTLVTYPGPERDAPYVNSMWEHQKEPYGGDAVNSYNDGPTEPGKPALGGFYEIETSSPGLELAPGERRQHVHRTFHIVGDEGLLDPIAQRMFGVSLAYVTTRMK